MGTKLIHYICPTCGGNLAPEGEGGFKCQNCGNFWEKEKIDDYGKILDEYAKIFEKLDDEKQKELANLVRRRFAETEKEYVSDTELTRICNKILDLNPDDFYSQFFLATCKDDYSLADFLSAMDIDEHYTKLEKMLDYLIRGLQDRWISAVGELIEKAKGRDVGKFDPYQTKFEAMAEKVKNGVFEPTLPRDIFIAYSSKDMAKVNALLRVLEEENHLECFVAARNLRHGSGAKENYREAIRTAMSNCKAVVFVSSASSRDMQCEASRELNYIKTHLPEMWRIEFLTEKYKGIPIERIFTTFFDGLEYCTSPTEVAIRYVDKYISAAESVEETHEEEERKEAERKEAERKEAERKEAERKEAERKEAERKEAERKEAERKEAERKEAERKEAERKEAERKEAERKEAERKEAERKEAERKEAERKEAERKEAERKEAERKAAQADSPLTDFEIENGVLKKYKAKRKMW